MICNPVEHGQGLVEYALILILVSIVVIIVLVVFGEQVGNLYQNLVGNVP